MKFSIGDSCSLRIILRDKAWSNKPEYSRGQCHLVEIILHQPINQRCSMWDREVPLPDFGLSKPPAGLEPAGGSNPSGKDRSIFIRGPQHHGFCSMGEKILHRNRSFVDCHRRPIPRLGGSFLFAFTGREHPVLPQRHNFLCN